MNLELTPAEYRDLLEKVILGTCVKEAAGNKSGLTEDSRAVEQILLAAARKFGYPELVEDHGSHLDLAEGDWLRIQKILDEFLGEEFWERLAGELGRRDFRKVASLEELEEIDKTGIYPERVADFIERYEEEFEQYGTNRLEINLLSSTHPEQVFGG